MSYARELNRPVHVLRELFLNFANIIFNSLTRLKLKVLT